MNSARLYLWQALDQAGQLQRGECLAQTQQEVYQQLFSQRLQPLSVVTARRWRAPDPQQPIALTRQLATLLQAGLPLIDSLHLLAEEQRDPHWRYILRDITERLMQGESFASASAQHQPPLPPLFAPLLALGELTGQLEQCCWRLAQLQEQRAELQQKVSSALRYPLFICALAGLICLLMLLLVLPEFAAIYRSFDAPLPWLTQRLLTLSAVLATYGPLLLLCLGLSVLLYRRQLRRHPGWRSYQERYLLLLPLFGPLLRGNCLSQLFYTLAMTQRSGLPLLQGLEACAQATQSHAYRQALLRIYQLVAQGTPLHIAIGQSPLFPPLCQQLIRVGEASGTLDTLLEQLAQWHQRQTLTLATELAQQLEPALMIVVGVIVGGLLIAMYLPIFQLGSVLV